MSKSKQTPLEEDELTVREVAALIGRDRRNVVRMIARGVFPGAHQLPRLGPTAAFLIPRKDVEAYLKKRQRHQSAH